MDYYFIFKKNLQFFQTDFYSFNVYKLILKIITNNAVFNQSMNYQKQQNKLWKMIGLSDESSHKKILSNQNSNEGKGMFSSYLDYKSKDDSFQRKDDSLQRYKFTDQKLINSIIQENPPLKTNLMTENQKQLIRNLNQLGLEFEEVEENDLLNQQYKQQYKQVGEQQSYNYEIASMTPLIESKSAYQRIKQLVENRVRKTKNQLSNLRNELHLLRNDSQKAKANFTSNHDQFQQYFINGLSQLQLHYQTLLNNQKSSNLEKQAKLRHEFQILQSKLEAMTNPITSVLMCEDISEPNDKKQLKHQGENSKNEVQINELKMLVEKYLGEKNEYEALNIKLNRQVAQFRQKIMQIESKTVQIKQSNDKLYEYIFDLEQKIAFQNEQMVQMSQKLKQQYYQKSVWQIQNMKKHHNEEIEKYLQQIQHLQVENEKYLKQKSEEQYNNYVNQQILILEKHIESYQQTIKELELKIEKQNAQIIKNDNQFNNKIKQAQTTLLENANLKALVQQKCNQINKLTQKLAKAQQKGGEQLNQLAREENLLLKKQNMQLKLSIDYYKNQLMNAQVNMNNKYSNLGRDGYVTDRSDDFYRTSQVKDVVYKKKQQQLYQKEEELYGIQIRLESQARKLQMKQLQIERQYQESIRKNQENKYKQNILTNLKTQKFIHHDDYGMKGVSLLPKRSNNFMVDHNKIGRRNELSSSQAQAIIERVKMKNLIKQCNCGFRTCRCQGYSKQSKGSQNSESREYRRLQYNIYNETPRTDDILKRDEKNIKMKLIEDKVKRLKSQLKTSMTSMKV